MFKFHHLEQVIHPHSKSGPLYENSLFQFEMPRLVFSGILYPALKKQPRLRSGKAASQGNVDLNKTLGTIVNDLPTDH